MERGSGMSRWRLIGVFAVCISRCLWPGLSWGSDESKAPPVEQREAISLADAAIRALQHNLHISISRQTKESRLADIVVEQAKFDPTLSVNAQYNRIVNPLNVPIFGGTLGDLTTIQTSDRRIQSYTVDATTNLLTGGNVDL